MKFSAREILAGLAVAAIAATATFAQPAPPHLGFVYPAGGQQGTTFTVSVGGQNLNGTSAALVSGTGVQVRVVGHERPLTQREINDLRDEAQRLQDKRTAVRADATKPAFGPDDEKRTSEIRELLATRGNRQYAPAIAETVTLEIALAPGASPGERELRLSSASGLSNPLVFRIDQLAEISAPVVTATSSRPTRTRLIDPRNGRPTPEAEVSLPVMMNGQILPGEVDRFRFAATKGQRLTFAVSARALLPYLADAVPGWFQATLAILDSAGRELAYADDYRFAPDPIVSCEIPTDGSYTLEIKDALFRGREDFVYRIAAGELPFITGIFPLGGSIGSHTRVEVSGWNLPRKQLTIDATEREPARLSLCVVQGGRFSNSVPFELEAGPDCVAAEPNDTNNNAQLLTLPAIVNGRIERTGDEDVFRFAGHAGNAVVAEVVARRLGSPLDSVLTLCDQSGRPLATNDDSEDKGTGLLTHHADSRLALTLPADGTYFLRIADAQRQGGPEYSYRLRVSAPQPDFELRIVPSTINLRAGATVPITVYALRRDGFTGEIALALQNAPNGFVLSGAKIPANEPSVRLTLTAPANAREDVPPLRVVGRSTISGAVVLHAAVAADDMMQAFAYKHLVPAKELRVCLVGRGSTLRILDQGPVRLTSSEPARIRVALPPSKAARSVTFELMEPPAGIAVQSVSCRGDVAEITLTCDATAKPGTEGTLIFQGFGQAAGAAPKSSSRSQRFPLGIVPAIPFKVGSTLSSNL